MFGVGGIIVDPVKQRLEDRSWQLVAYILHKANSFPQGQTYVNLLGFPLLTAMTLQAFVGMFFLYYRVCVEDAHGGVYCLQASATAGF